MTRSSYYYSQYGQDAFLEEFIFKGKLKDGFFVEAGAADGVLDSNTLVRREQSCFASYIGLDEILRCVLRFGMMEDFLQLFWTPAVLVVHPVVKQNVINLRVKF